MAILQEDILKKVKELEISTRKIVENILSGQYLAAFKGPGIQFADCRPYIPGDDVRHLSWRLTAKTGVPFIKTFEEERELTILLMVDGSASQKFASQVNSKLENLLELMQPCLCC